MIQPWLNEPDRKEWTAHGLPCVIIRHPHMGHLCGYVGVPEGHPAYSIAYYDSDWNNPVANLDVHGGVTFSEMGDGESLPAGYWWIGFDCAHLGDLCPGFHGSGDGVYRDMTYVTAETERLAVQLAAMAAEGCETT